MFIISPPGVRRLVGQDQCRTLAGIGALVRERFRVDYTLAGLDLLLHRIGWSVQVPARRGRRGHTLVVRVTAQGSKRVSVAALIR